MRAKDAWNLLDADMLDWYSRVTPPLQFALKLQEMREMIEPYAAALAAGNHEARTRERLTRAHQAMADAQNVDEWVRADLDFHLCVLAACSNELLIPLGALIERTLEGQLRLNAKRAEVYNVARGAQRRVRSDHRARRRCGPPCDGRSARRDARTNRRMKREA